MAVTAVGVSAATIAAYVAAAAAVAGAAVAAYGAYQQGEAQAAAAKYNKKVAEQNAEQARLQGEAEARSREARNRRILATQRAGYGASGVIASEGSPLIVQMESEDEAALDAARARYAGITGQSAYLQEAGLMRFQGQQARRSGRLAAGTSLLQGVSSGAGAYGRIPSSGSGGYSSGAPYYGYTP